MTIGPLQSAGPQAAEALRATRAPAVATPAGAARPLAADGHTVVVRVRRLDPDVPLPSYATPGDAGADLVTTVDSALAPGQRALLPTGIGIELPPGFAGFVHPRSGLALRAGLGIVNAPGTIDSGYRGEVKVLVINHDPADVIQLRRGDRIAQLVIQRVEYARFEVAEILTESHRGAAGYGSTGGAHALRADWAADPRSVENPRGDDQ